MISMTGGRVRARILISGILCVGALALSGCSDKTWEFAYPESQADERLPAKYSNEKPTNSSIGSEDGGIDLFGMFGKGGKDGGGQGGGAGIGVNSFLWRASLDTVSFMPLTSADPFGGVIITDWYTPPEARSERFKMNIYILGRQLRADGIRVAIFRQAQDGKGLWIDAAVKNNTATTMENQILTRARQLRVASASAN